MRWTAAAGASASGVSAYTVVATAAGRTPVQAKTSETTVLVDGLANGVPYSLTVVAENAAGKSPPSPPVEATPRSACERSFALYRTLPVGTFPVAVVAADLTGTGRQDLVVANGGFFPGEGTVSVLTNDGAANFSKGVEYPVTDFPRALVVADFDRNGTQDVMAAGSRETILFNDGKGGLAPSAEFGNRADSLAVTDLNRDGLPDFAIADQGSSSAERALNRGDGTFGPLAGFGAGTRPMPIAAGDVNGDGIPDLIVGYQEQLALLYGNGDGTFAPQSLQDIAGPTSIALGDFDGDGLTDIAVGNTAISNEVTILFSDGRRGLPFRTAEISSGTPPVHVLTADIDRDGHTDIVYDNEGDSFGVVRSLGGGSFAPPKLFKTPSLPEGIAVADLNGDDFPDVVVTDRNDNAISIFLNVCE